MTAEENARLWETFDQLRAEFKESMVRVPPREWAQPQYRKWFQALLMQQVTHAITKVEIHYWKIMQIAVNGAEQQIERLEAIREAGGAFPTVFTDNEIACIGLVMTCAAIMDSAITNGHPTVGGVPMDEAIERYMTWLTP